MKSLTDKDVSDTLNFIINNGIERIAEKLLFVLGFRSNLLGTKYLKEGIVMLYNNDDYSCKDLYLGIAQKYGATHTAVERSMRHAINESFAEGYLDRLNDLFRCQIVDSRYPLTNSEFLSVVCTWVHIEKQDSK